MSLLQWQSLWLKLKEDSSLESRIAIRDFSNEKILSENVLDNDMVSILQ